MSWLGWLLVFYFGFFAIITPILVGKQRRPMTGGEAAITVLWYLTMIAMVALGWPR